MKSKIILSLAALMLTAGSIMAASWELFRSSGAPNGIASPVYFEGSPLGSIACSSDGKIVYVVQNSSLWKSTDGGETWKILKP